jgi:hypothetical protein
MESLGLTGQRPGIGSPLARTASNPKPQHPSPQWSEARCAHASGEEMVESQHTFRPSPLPRFAVLHPGPPCLYPTSSGGLPGP